MFADLMFADNSTNLSVNSCRISNDDRTSVHFGMYISNWRSIGIIAKLDRIVVGVHLGYCKTGVSSSYKHPKANHSSSEVEFLKAPTEVVAVIITAPKNF